MADRPAARPGGPDGTPVISVAELLTRDAPGAGRLDGREVALPPGVRRDPGRPPALIEAANRLIVLAWKPQFRIVTVAGVVLLTGLLANALLGLIAPGPRPAAAEATDGGFPAAEAPAADPAAPVDGPSPGAPVDRFTPAPVAGTSPLPRPAPAAPAAPAARPAPRPATAPAGPAPAAAPPAPTAPARTGATGGGPVRGAAGGGADDEPTGLAKVTKGLGDTVSGLAETLVGGGADGRGSSRSSDSADSDDEDSGRDSGDEDGSSPGGSGGLIGGLVGGLTGR